MGLLILLLGNHALDPTSRQVPANRPGRIRLVSQSRRGTCPGRSSPELLHHERVHEILEHRRVPGLPRADQQHQRSAVAVNQGMDLCAQPTARAADRVIIRLNEQILVTRWCPLCAE